MKVTEICGYQFSNLGFIAYYHTKIKDRNIILQRTLRYNMTTSKRKSNWKIR